MALSDWIPPYWRDTRDFQQLKRALDDEVQPMMNFVEYFFGMCANASKWPDEILTETLLKCGYPEAANASRERKEELIRRALRTRGLMTAQLFSNYLKEAFGFTPEDAWPYAFVIDPATMHVEVAVPCEDCSDAMKPRNGAESFRYDNLMTNLQYSFPAGVSLDLRCDMPKTEFDRYYGAVPAVTVDIRCTLNISWEEVTLYDDRFTDYEGAYHPFEGWRIDGTVYATEQALNGAGYYLEYSSPVYLGETQYLTIHRYDGVVDIQGLYYWDTWYNLNSSSGYTDHPTQSVVVYSRADSWAPVDAYYDPEDGRYFVVHQWFVDEAAMNSAGYYLEIPATGLEYGVMTSSGDEDKGFWGMGDIGHIEREMGNMANAGFVEYGVITATP